MSDPQFFTSGVLTSVTDPVSRSLSITTGSNGFVSQISDSMGTIANYEYFTSSNKLKTVTYNDGSKYKFEYTTIASQPYLATVKDALDNILEAHDYDTGSGKATTSEKDGGVDALEFDYSNSAYTVVTDSLGNQTKYYYTRVYGTNLVTKTEGVCGCGGGGSEVTEYFYDTNNSWLNLTRKTDALGQNTDYTYDTSRNITQITDVLGTQTYTYNSLGEVLTTTDRMSGVITNTYSSVGNLLTSTDPLSHTTTLTYNSLGRVATVVDARSKTTSLSYDSDGLLTQVTDANGKHTNFAYDDRARLTSVTNALSQTTSFGYDDNNRLNSVTYPDTNDVAIGYDLAGRRTSVTDENGHSTTYAYDAAYRLTGITDALSHATSFGYDDMSNLTSQTDALGNVTNLEYDDFNRLKKIIYPVPSPSASPRLAESFTYNKLGSVKTHVDTAGHTTTYDYDNADRMTKITDALSHETQFTYNARTQLTKVKDALNQEYNFTYDALGRELSEARGSATMSFGYDAVGNRTSRTDFNGVATTYSYDNLNRLTGISYNGSSDFATYGYDDLSRLVSAENQNGTVGFAYDNRGRPTGETDVWGHEIGYTYDAAGNRSGLTLDSSTLTTYTYDNANRLTTLTDESSNNFTFGYDNANRLTSRAMPNGVNSTYEYDGMSRLKRLKHAHSTTTLYDDQYTYNSANQISQIVGLSQTKSFTYDNVNRLTGMTDGSNSETYTYDAVGNRTASHLAGYYYISAFNRMTLSYPYDIGYDANGNMTSWVNGQLPLTTEVYGQRGWDNENRLTLVDVAGDDVTYSYDALGRLVKRDDNGRPGYFSYDGTDVVMDDDGHTNTTKYQNGPGVDNKLKLKTGSTSKYFLQDHLGSTVGLANSSGAVNETNSYDSFGNPTYTDFSTRFQFTGREYDSFTGLQYNRARWYSPQIGRFISEDPAGLRTGPNLYTYVVNDPLSFTDPEGLFPSKWWWKYHQGIQSNALYGMASPDQIGAMNDANQSFDERTQDPIYAPYHAMSRPGQSPDEARGEANDFVRRKICLAKDYEARGLDSSAMEALGQAGHTLQDARSPAHQGFPPAWPDTRTFTAIHIWHYIQETFFPGDSNISAAEDDTRRLWSYFKGAQMPDDFFNPASSQQTCSCSR